MRWLNEPGRWEGREDRLDVRTDPDTDFWQRTHYGFRRDSGHFFYREMTRDFTASVQVEGRYRDQYDQAGLMLRASDQVWLKAGIEYVDGAQQASVVVTRSYSDWSVSPLAPAAERFWVRVTRQGGNISVEGSTDGETYALLRIAWLIDDAPLQVGAMCASPEGSGFDVTFHELRVLPRIG